MLVFPEIDPVAFSIGPLKVHWYGLTYLFAFIAAWGLALWRIRLYRLDWTHEQVSDLIFYCALGVILGGRLGYMLFYGTKQLIDNPLSLFKLWEGGMSFHGGLLGVAFALWLFVRKIKKPFWVVADFVAPLVPIGLAAGRVGNFINGELWGRPANVPWAMIFPDSDGQPRHPSQLYELGLEGVALFILVWWYAAKPRPAGRVSAVFLMGYATSRFLVEFFREPDVQLGYLAFGWLTMGQLLSIPMLLAGIWLWWAKR
ncbi:prolipoprotein diacylglyceryl transferase [Legionella spiritensis]|uniref:Phosphatidylglycerol--prolipoprotein diacylglyceryl transferase n=1 Tax=Legionella spiritensis TaxID=452 RepID=A0A0W0YZI4_LEGSP|nr:prolipoprotein diacylglyceryl transferase [Legionella spiritensis]KTD62264.1 prolipoprotein diacylglyceryl transferase [Legionella spiritensis]SNV28649.1 prolipoprotein diacylglyceryl transferase [Legionella spiritensis]VEG91704.1 prolipoprotein diacylglyceryl transferase [Legionella spiritensis]